MGDFKKISASYIQARDPSILAWNQFRTTHKKNLQDDFCEENDETVVLQEEKEEDKYLQVYLRIKNDVSFEDLYHIEDNNICCKPGVDGSHQAYKKYGFSKIFSPDVSQIEIFNDTIKPRMLSFINGNNCSLMTYGASGSGKTFTIVGTENEPGIIPRALEYLFRTTKPLLEQVPKIKTLPNGKIIKLEPSERMNEMKRCKNLLDKAFPNSERLMHINTYSKMKGRLSEEPIATVEPLEKVSLHIFITFAEIYNEGIYDLLEGSSKDTTIRKKLRLGGCDKDFYIKDLTEVYVTSGLDAYQLLQFGRHNLNYAKTALNPNSSRSHFIFTIKLVQSVEGYTNDAVISSFNFCDLAGAERLSKTGNVGERLKESNNINVSLSVLGRCIQAIRDGQGQLDQCKPPFRDSKFTQLFQKALMGMENIAMIVNINPSKNMISETQHVLKFAAVATEIICEEPVKVKKNIDSNRKEIEHLQLKVKDQLEEIELLTEELGNKTEEYDKLKLAAEELAYERRRILKGYEEVMEQQKKMYKKEIDELKHQLEIYKKKSLENVPISETIEISDDEDEEETTSSQEFFKMIKERDDKIKSLEEQLIEKNDELYKLNSLIKEKEKLANRCISENKLLMNRCLILEEKLNDKEEELGKFTKYCNRLSRQLDKEDDDSGTSTPRPSSSCESLS